MSLSLTGIVPPHEGNKIYTFLRLLWLSLLSRGFFTVVEVILVQNDLMEPRHHPITTHIEEESVLWRLMVLFIFTAVITPLFEELSFRLALSQKKRDVMWGLSFFIAILLTFFTDIESLARPYLWFFDYPVVFLLLGGLVFLMIRQLVDSVRPGLEFPASRTSLKWMLLLTGILFSVIHVKVSPTTDFWFLYPVIYAGHFVHGYIYAFTRLQLGFFYAVACHGAYNGLLFLITVLDK